MEFNEAFAVLGISVDSDEKTIKEAYRVKLAATNPEDDPEGFKRLRTAFESASKYLKDKALEKEEDKDKELTKADLFVNKIADIYNKMSLRRDIMAWEEAFSDPDLQSLEYEEEYKEKLLVYLMDNFYLPGEVWKLIDSTFGIASSEASLREKFPAGFVNYIIRSCTSSGTDELDMNLFEGDDSAPYDAYIRLYYDSRDAYVNGDFNNALKIVEDSKNMDIYHPIMDVSYVYSLMERKEDGDLDKAVSMAKELESKYPENYLMQLTLTNAYWNNKEREEAFNIAKKIIETEPNSVLLNKIMAECLFEKEDYKEAKEHVYNLMDAGLTEEYMEMLWKINAKIANDFKQKWENEKDYDALIDWGWCMYQDKKASQIYTLIKKEENNIPDEFIVDFHRLKARVCLSIYELDEAIASSQIAIDGMEKRVSESKGEQIQKNSKRLYNDILVRANTYEEKGLQDVKYYDDAIKNYQKLNEINKRNFFQTQFSIAKIHRRKGEYDKAYDIIDSLIYDYGEMGAAAEGIECANWDRNPDKLIEYGDICLNYFPEFEKMYGYLSDYYFAVEAWDEIDKLVEKAKANNVDNWYLEANVYLKDHEYLEDEQIEVKIKEFNDKYEDKLNRGSKEIDKEQVLAQARELFNMHPSAYLMAINADVCFDLAMFDDAIKLFERAIDQAPHYVYALRRLAKFYFGRSYFEEAIFLRKKAIAFSENKEPIPGDIEFIAKCYMCLGDFELALKWFEMYDEKVEPNSFSDEKEKCLVNIGQVDRAIEVVNEQSKNAEEFYDSIDTVYKGARQFDASRTSLDEFYEKLDRLDAKRWVSDDDIEACKDYCIDKVFSLVNDGFDEDNIVKYIELLFEHTPDFSEYVGYSQVKGVEDFLFMIILLDRRDLWEKYSPILKKWSKLKMECINNTDLKYPRLVLQRKLLSEFYTLSDEEMEELLSDTKEMWLCLHCTNSFCIELKGTELLFLLRQKKFDEVKAKIQHYKELHYDDYIHSVEMAMKYKKGLGNDSRD